MERFSIDMLKSRLRRTTWIPLGMMAALFLGAMGTMLFRQHQSHMKSISYALDEIMHSQETQITQDIFLGQEEGIQIRIQALLDSWKSKYPETEACIHYSIQLSDAPVKSGGSCAIEAEANGILSEATWESLKIMVGNKTLAEIRYAVIRPTTLSDVFPPLLLAVLLAGLMVAFVSHSSLVNGVENKVLSPLLQQITQDERDAAIADTTRMLAHDIRKPFHLVQIALVRLKEAKNKQARELGQNISTEIEQSMRAVDSMIRDILDVSRKMKPNLEVVSVGTLMDRLGETISRLYPNTNTRLKLDFRRRHRVMADPEQLMRVLMNLVENAYQAVGDSGTVTVSVREIDPNGRKRVQFSIQNDGPVIPESDLGQLFTPYFTKRKDGTGLGLTIAKKIVEEHGGAISWFSNKNEGTCFSFVLKSASKEDSIPHLKPLASSENELDRFQDRHVLIFDDEKIVRDHWSRHAKNQGFHTVLDFKSWEDFVAQEGFQFVDARTVAFVDVHYKGSRHDGLEIAKSLRKIGIKKIYAITGDIESARTSGLFTEVFGKDIPANFATLVG
jgi:signal transduction histidine kinase